MPEILSKQRTKISDNKIDEKKDKQRRGKACLNCFLD
jgi:hypothetical protein